MSSTFDLSDVESLLQQARSEASVLDGKEVDGTDMNIDYLFDEKGRFTQFTGAMADTVLIDLRSQTDRDALSRFVFFHKDPYVCAALEQRISELNLAKIDQGRDLS